MNKSPDLFQLFQPQASKEHHCQSHRRCQTPIGKRTVKGQEKKRPKTSEDMYSKANSTPISA